MNNKDKLVFEASLLMSDQGYDGFTMDALLAQTGIAKSNAYYHFPTKELLGLDVLQFWCETLYQFENSTLNSNALTAGPRLQLWQQKMTDFQIKSDFAGTIPDHLAYQINTEPARTLFQEYMQKRHDSIEQFLKNGQQHRDFWPSLNSNSVAWLIIDLLSGASVNTSIVGNVEPLNRAFSQINSLIVPSQNHGLKVRG